ncbi:MAG: YcgL domain-containing protein [Alcanivoracaceae bacterium]|nr:YcgL domain-containing protein [Alcanivoracaceae bacterium]
MSSEYLLCSIFRSSKRTEMYLYVKKGTELDSLPEPLMKQFGDMSLVMDLLLREERPLARADVKKVMAMIQEQGFYLQMPPAEQEPSLMPRHDNA